MLRKLLKFSVEHRWLVLMLTIAIAIVGIFSFSKLAIDAVPDITNVQVQINTEAAGYTPLEVEQRITFPIETIMAGMPALDYTRSLSRYGLSQVTVVFKDGTDIYFARQLISERLQEIRQVLPDNVSPAMGPIATGLGEIYMYTLKNLDGSQRYSPLELRTIQDWIIKPQLRTVPGVVEVNATGGYVKQYHVTPYPEKLLAFKLNFSDVSRALLNNNENVGAGYIEKNGEQLLVRVPGQARTIEDIKDIMVLNDNGTPIYIRDLADVVIGHELRSGAATTDGKETVLGNVFMLKGENSREVARAVHEKMHEIKRSLPEGVLIETVYNRSDLVRATIKTVRNNLLEGAFLVIAVLFVFLGNFRAALIAALVIPLSMLFTISGMVANNITANLMSLGALDFGIIVDGSIIIVENCLRRLCLERRNLGRMLSLRERLDVVFDASREVRKATMFGEFIIMVVYLPILTLSGVEGKMFHPMAITVIIALLGAMIFSLTFVPAAVAIFINKDFSESELRIVGQLRNFYREKLSFLIEKKQQVFIFAGVLLFLSSIIATRLGTEFMPQLDEGDIALHALRIPGTSLTQAIEMQHVIEDSLKKFPEVKHTFAKIGTPDIATDPMPPNVADGFVILHPRENWPDPSKSKDQLVSEIAEELLKIPGNNYEFTQPIEMRFNELIAGVRSDVAVKLFGDNLSQLVATANEIANALKGINGASDVSVEPTEGLPVLNIKINRKKLHRYGLSLSDVQDVVKIATGGNGVGEIFDGDRRFELVVRLPEVIREDIDSLKSLAIPLPEINFESDLVSKSVRFGSHSSKPYVPLGEIASIKLEPGPSQIGRENGKRKIFITANVRDRDLGSFVEEARMVVGDKVSLPTGYWISWGGQFENLISARNRLFVVVPLTVLLIFSLLYATFGTVRDSLIVFSGVPLGLTGGIISLWLRGIPFSISAAVGFIALSGVAVLNGLVMVTFIKDLQGSGKPLREAIIEGSVARIRPVLMTALVAALGFVPMALATGTGAEVQRPLATVVIGGIISSTLLTLIILPLLYDLFAIRQENSK